MMEHYIRNEAEMSQDAPNHTKNKTRKLSVPHRTRLTPAAREEQIINVAAAHFARRKHTAYEPYDGRQHQQHEKNAEY